MYILKATNKAKLCWAVKDKSLKILFKFKKLIGPILSVKNKYNFQYSEIIKLFKIAAKLKVNQLLKYPFRFDLIIN